MIDYNTKTLQANILRGTGKKFASSLFFRFNPFIHKSKILNILKNIKLTNHEYQRSESDRHKNDKKLKKHERTVSQNILTTLSLTKKGYDFLKIKSFHKTDQYFIDGMNHRNVRGSVGQYLVNRKNDKINIDHHGVFIFYADCPVLISNYLNNSLLPNIFHIFNPLSNNILLKNEKPDNNISPIGFKDGLSTIKDPTVNADISLVEEHINGEIHHGSFLAIRFYWCNPTYIAKLGDTISNTHNISEDFAKGMLIGRTPNGVPLDKVNPERNALSMPYNTNFEDFDYNSPSPSKCPHFAHARVMNPRNERGITKNKFNIVRRSLIVSDDANIVMFMSYQNSIKDQLIPLFRRMGYQSLRNQKDILLYNTREAETRGVSQFFEAQHPLTNESISIEREKILTQARGGDFFYTPSLSFFRNMHLLVES